MKFSKIFQSFKAFNRIKQNLTVLNDNKQQFYSIWVTFVILQFQFYSFMLVSSNFQTLSEFGNLRLIIQK